jgi:hypothetical protein
MTPCPDFSSTPVQFQEHSMPQLTLRQRLLASTHLSDPGQLVVKLTYDDGALPAHCATTTETMPGTDIREAGCTYTQYLAHLGRHGVCGLTGLLYEAKVPCNGCRACCTRCLTIN